MITLPKKVKANGSDRSDGRSSRMLLMVSIDAASKAHFCALPLQESQATGPKETTLMLDGSVPTLVVRRALRDLGWRNQRGDPCYVILPSEDVLLLIEEFPTRDLNEVRAMADGLIQGMVELDQKEHSLSIHVLHAGASSTVCALAVFYRKRVERIFECMQRLGITNPRFVLDVIGLWQVSKDVAANGFWGRAVKDDATPRVVVKGLKVVDGVVRAVRQRFYVREEVDEAWLKSIACELFPQEFQAESNHGITWDVSQRAVESPAHMADLCRLAASGHLINFELEPTFWKEHLRRQRKRRGLAAVAVMSTAVYALFLLCLMGVSIWQWYKGGQLKQLLEEQKHPYQEVMQVKEELDAARASALPTGNVLEVLSRITESLPESFTYTSFAYRFQESVKLKGVAPEKDLVYGFSDKLKENPLFTGARTIGDIPRTPAGFVPVGYMWEIVVPLKKERPVKSKNETSLKI